MKELVKRRQSESHWYSQILPERGAETTEQHQSRTVGTARYFALTTNSNEVLHTLTAIPVRSRTT